MAVVGTSLGALGIGTIILRALAQIIAIPEQALSLASTQARQPL
jgi:hypothetical protein